MSGKNHYHFRYHDDALRGYRMLSLEERGAYTTILDLLYSNGDYLQDNERILAAEMGVSTRKYRSLRDALMKKGKIYFVATGLISNRRFEEEIGRREQRAVQAKLGGRIGGRNKAENDKIRNEINADVYPNSSSSIFQNKNPSESSVCNGRSSVESLADFQRRNRARNWR